MLIDQLCYRSALRKQNPAIKLVLTLMLLVSCVCIRNLWISSVLILGVGMVTIVFGKIPLRIYIRLMKIPAMFIIMGTLPMVIGITNYSFAQDQVALFGYYFFFDQKGGFEGINTAVTSFGAVSCLYFLTLSTPFIDILVVLRNLHVPNLFLELMLLIYRFMFVISEVVKEMLIAGRCRLGNQDWITSLKTMGKILGTVLVKSVEQSNKIYQAMEARGYQGKIVVLNEEYKTRKREVAFVFVVGVALLVGAKTVK